MRKPPERDLSELKSDGPVHTGPFLFQLPPCFRPLPRVNSGMARKRLIIGVVVTALSISAVLGDAASESRQVPEGREQILYSFAPIVKKTGPAVVNIYARKVVRQRSGWMFDDPFFKRFFGEEFPWGGGGRGRRRVENSLGSGVIVRPEGIIVTNNHVIKDANDITVVLSDRRELDAKVLIKDKRTDIAVLRVELHGGKLPAIRLADSDNLLVGDLVLALGNPFGVGRTVTSGIVSALARTSVGITDYRFFIQTDAAINPGNSGGALVDIHGALIGINTAIYSRSGGSLGIGFAVPSNMVRTVVASAVSGKPLVRPWLSLVGKTVNSDIAEAIGLLRPAGVLVEKIYKDGPADRAGLLVGDVILMIGRHEVQDAQALRFRMATRPLGESVKLTVFRGGKVATHRLDLVAPPEEPPRNTTVLAGRHPLFGAVVANLNPALTAELGVSDDRKGVIILRIKRGSPAARYGFKPGDILLEIEGAPVRRVFDLRKILEMPFDGWNLKLRRGKRQMNVRIG